jgi:hypothetical protein
MNLLFFVFITLILLIVIITDSREKKKVKEHINEVTYDNIIIDCNTRKEEIDIKIRNEE